MIHTELPENPTNADLASGQREIHACIDVLQTKFDAHKADTAKGFASLEGKIDLISNFFRITPDNPGKTAISSTQLAALVTGVITFVSAITVYLQHH